MNDDKLNIFEFMVGVLMCIGLLMTYAAAL